jgi:4-hydroxythreonine-4-phosphate dehydrogenase
VSKPPSVPRPIIAITTGDAAGVGPEIIVKALARPEAAAVCRPFVVGDARRLRRAAAICDAAVSIRPIDRVEDANFDEGTIDCLDLGLIPDDLPFGVLSPLAGDAAYRYVANAIDLATRGLVSRSAPHP